MATGTLFGDPRSVPARQSGPNILGRRSCNRFYNHWRTLLENPGNAAVSEVMKQKGFQLLVVSGGFPNMDYESYSRRLACSAACREAATACGAPDASRASSGCECWRCRRGGNLTS